jgi:hypothetical protein
MNGTEAALMERKTSVRSQAAISRTFAVKSLACKRGGGFELRCGFLTAFEAKIDVCHLEIGGFFSPPI